MNPGIGMNEWNGGREFQIILAAVWSKWERK